MSFFSNFKLNIKIPIIMIFFENYTLLMEINKKELIIIEFMMLLIMAKRRGWFETDIGMSRKSEEL
jgi:hypothetical protein